MKINIKTINLCLFIIFSAIILITMLILKPVIYGDGNEYFLMTESLSKHFSPNLKPEDIKIFQESFDEKINPYQGYFKNNNDKYYSYHFWAYSLISVPAKMLLEVFQSNVGKCLQITNALLIIVLLTCIQFFSKFNEKQKLFFMLLMIFSPILLFVHWTHTEIFIVSLITISIILFHSGKYTLAIIFSVIASFQNQAIIIWTAYLLLKAIVASKYNIKKSIKYIAISTITIIPNIFYLLTYNTFNLISAATSINNISLFRIYEMFFDLNIGLLTYIPISLIFFFGIILIKTINNKKLILELELLIVIILMMIICSMTYNWNHGTAGPTRYVIWMMPFIFFSIIINIDSIFNKTALKYILIFGIILQAIIIIQIGPFITSRGNYIIHTPTAKFVLNNFPEAYNPSGEIFCERTMHYERSCDNPTIYRDDKNNECKKAYLNCDGIEILNRFCKNTNPKIITKCNIEKTSSRKESGKWFYVNYN